MQQDKPQPTADSPSPPNETNEEPNPAPERNALAEEYGLSPEQTKMFSLYL